MWCFELQQDFVESTYTPEFAMTFYLLSARVKTAGYGYANSCGVQISVHIDIEFCLKIDKRCN